VEVRILGPLEVVHGGTPVALGGTKQRAVFAMLALRVNRVVSMDFLVDGLWGTAPPTDPINVVQVYLSRLRKALHPAGSRDTGDGTLIRRRPGYLLQLDPEHLDLHRFQRLTREGSQHRRPQRHLHRLHCIACIAKHDGLDPFSPTGSRPSPPDQRLSRRLVAPRVLRADVAASEAGVAGRSRF